MLAILTRLKEWAGRLRLELQALHLAFHDPRVPWLARLCAALIVAYALSPIDLIPDFFPVIGYLDEVLILPITITIVLRMIPVPVMEECRKQAAAGGAQGVALSRMGALLVVCCWILMAFVGARVALSLFMP